jgi:PKD repeat protein
MIHKKQKIIHMKTLSFKADLLVAIIIMFAFTASAQRVEVRLTEADKALRNPEKGLRWAFKNLSWWKDFPNQYHPYVSLGKWYIAYNNLEDSESDGIDKIKDYCDILWKNAPNGNNKVIPRVYLQYGSNESVWPSDLSDGDYSSEQFKARLTRIIRRLAELWDNDPRVLYVEIGFIGQWAELHDPSPSKEIQEILRSAYTTYFKHKKILAHHRQTPSLLLFDPDYPFGIFWDSFSHKREEWLEEDIEDLDIWRTQVIGGEVAYNWGGCKEYLGNNPTETMSNSAYYNHVINYIRRVHANHVGWVTEYDVDDENTKEGAALMQKALGYRYVISKVSFPEKINCGQNFTVSFTVKNTGSSPFYYDWPVEVSLLNPDTKEVVWKSTFRNIDIREWLPGDDWVFDKNSSSVLGYYAVPAKEYTETGVFHIPDNLPKGKYILALSCLDPSGMLPAIKFAVTNYFNGGRHPIGYVGVGQDISSVELTGVAFDDLQADRSLHYAYPTPPAVIVTSPSEDVEWIAGEQQTVKWESYGNISKVDILYSVDGGNNWVTLVSDVDNTDSLELTVPDVNSTKCLIKVKDASSSAFDECSAFFTINNSAIFSSFTYQITPCSPVVSFTNTSSSLAETYLWDFGDGITSTDISPEHKYLTPGDYTIELAVSDGTNSDTKTKNITVNFAPVPSNIRAESQTDGNIKLSADASGTINWYDVAAGGTPVATGNSVNITSSATTFYAENVTGGGTIYTGGKTDKGTGGYCTNDDGDALFGLQFDAKTDITIKSVMVFNKGTDYTGARVFTVQDASGKVVSQTTAEVSDGEQRLELYLRVPQGSGYLLLADNKKGLWQDSDGASYPYPVGDVVDITAGIKYDGTSFADHYYFFYDWEVITGTESCVSKRVKVDLLTGVKGELSDKITVYPNPASNYVKINNLPVSNCSVILYNSSMQQLKLLQSNGSNTVFLNTSKFKSGIYFGKIILPEGKHVYKKLFIIR